MTPHGRQWFLLAFTALTALLASCSTYEEKRLNELWKEKGFGTKAQGDATVENYISGGDSVQFLIPATQYQSPAARELYRLTSPQTVSVDGKILIPYVGPVMVLGMTEAQLATYVKGMLRPVFNFPIQLQAHIGGDSKNIYGFGETRLKGVIPMRLLGADLTVFEAVAKIGWTDQANLSRVFIIRPDAEHPLVVELDLHEMYTTGYTKRNMHLQENDVIYIPPTFLGLIARILERALAPVSVAVRAMLGVAQIRQSYDVATGRSDVLFFRF